jgi:hypothetical protein
LFDRPKPTAGYSANGRRSIDIAEKVSGSGVKGKCTIVVPHRNAYELRNIL